MSISRLRLQVQMGALSTQLHRIFIKGGHHIRCPLSWQTPLIGDCKLPYTLCSRLLLLCSEFQANTLSSVWISRVVLNKPRVHCSRVGGEAWTRAVFRTREQDGTSAVITRPATSDYLVTAGRMKCFPVAGTRLETAGDVSSAPQNHLLWLGSKSS